MNLARTSMSGVDLAWLRMEQPSNPMVILCVLTFASRIKLGALRALVEARLLQFERFRQTPVQTASGAYWHADPDFSLEAHVHPLVLPPRSTQIQLEAAASELASTSLDPRHPLWQIHLIERYRKGSALIARFHHCYADGIAMMRVLATLTDTDPDAPPTKVVAPVVATAQAAAPSDLLGLRPLLDTALTFAQGAAGGAADLAAASLHALAHPTEAARFARELGAATQELTHIALLSDDPPTPLKGSLGTRKQVAWADPPVSLSDVKAIGKTLSCTVNDVLLATVTSVLARHLEDCGKDVRGQTIRALVPVNLRAEQSEAALGNHFGLVFVNLPIGEPNRLARLFAVHKDMQALKHSAQPMLALWLLTAMGLLPASVEEQAIDIFTKKASIVISNVPGPQHPLYLAGARIEGQYFWVPQAGSIGVGVSILTYDGNVYFGLMTDGKVIAAPRAVVRLFAAEFEKLLLCTIAGATDEPFALANEASAPPARQRTRTSRTSPSGSRKRAARPAT